MLGILPSGARKLVYTDIGDFVHREAVSESFGDT